MTHILVQYRAAGDGGAAVGERRCYETVLLSHGVAANRNYLNRTAAF